MSKFQCKCGNTIRISGEIPNPLEYLFISDVEYDKFHGMIDAEELYSIMKSVLKCDNCNRLWIYTNGLDNPPQLYQPEEY